MLRTLLAVLVIGSVTIGCDNKNDTGQHDGFGTLGPGGGGPGNGVLDTSLGSFDCGDQTCLVDYEYCHITHPGTKDGEADGVEYRCDLTPETCLPDPTCGCLDAQGVTDPEVEECGLDIDGHIVVQLYLP